MCFLSGWLVFGEVEVANATPHCAADNAEGFRDRNSSLPKFVSRPVFIGSKVDCDPATIDEVEADFVVVGDVCCGCFLSHTPPSYQKGWT